MAGTLYVVATPIGNMEDLTRRAERVLREVDLIACEDTRHTRKLLSHFGITTPAVSYHEHNEATRAAWLVEKLAGGVTVALVSDAGTPLISDPGHDVVARAIEAGIAVVAVPGPSALLAALAASGMPPDSFHFLGFLPSKAVARRRVIEEMASFPATSIFYEAPHRILETLADLAGVLGPRPIAVARELTKLHEEFLRGTAASVRAELAARSSVKGEFTVVVSKPPAPGPVAATAETIQAEVVALIRQGLPRMEAMKQVARAHGLPKRDVYRILEESYS